MPFCGKCIIENDAFVRPFPGAVLYKDDLPSLPPIALNSLHCMSYIPAVSSSNSITVN